MTSVRQLKQSQMKNINIHLQDIENMIATRNSLTTFINDIRERNSAPDIVLAADELPDISKNSVPVLPSYKLPVFKDVTTDVVKALQVMITYSKHEI